MPDPTPSALRRYVRDTWPADLSTALRQRILELHRAIAGDGPVAETLDDAGRFAGLPPAWFERDERGALIGIAGLSRRPTRHRLEGLRAPRYAWCAFDCLFLPTLLEAELEVSSDCPVSGTPIRLRVSPGEILSVRPAAVRLVFATPPPGEFGDSIRETFCAHVRFCDGEAADEWARGASDRVALDLDRAFRLAAWRNEVVFGDVHLPAG